MTFFQLFVAALVATACSALPPLDANSASLTTVLNTAYDYVVVGGGTAGLALAARLSENPSGTVLVLEAGSFQQGNPGIDIPGFAGSTFLSPIDWAFFTAPQTTAGGQSVYWPRGKVLGGTSQLNFLAVTRGFAGDFDAWGALGNPGWSWASLFPSFKKSENFSVPGGNSENQPVAFNPFVHGYKGPVDVSYPPYISPQYVGFFNAVRARGIPVAQDLSSGDTFGISWSPSTIVATNQTRESSQTAYLNPIVARLNLVIITNAQVVKINWQASSSSSSTSIVASGVSFVATGTPGTILFANASREVVLSAGSVQTPQLLELSGIGNPAVLTPLGIPVAVSLPGVGENLQDHPTVILVYKLKPGVISLDTLQFDPAALAAALADYAQGKGILTQVTYALAYLIGNGGPSFLSFIDQAKALSLMTIENTGISTKQLLKQVALYLLGSPIMEVLSVNAYFGANAAGEPGTSYISLAACLQHSFSRGNIHIISSNPLAYPRIDPQYLQHPVDTFFLSKAAQWVRQLASFPGFAAFLAAEAEPGPSVRTNAQWDTWVKNNVRTEYHPVGTASMLPRADGGVVDPSLRVFGTANVRVVDLSIVPLHVGTHPQTVAYAIAERAAGIILAA